MDRISIVIDGEVISQEEIEYEFFRHELIQALSGKAEIETPTKEEIITQIVQLRAVNLLANLKGVSTTSDEVEERISAFKQNTASLQDFNERARQFGEDRFWRFEKNRYFIILNTEKIKKNLVEDEREKYKQNNADAPEGVLIYTASRKFDDLVVEAVGLLEISTSY